MNSRMTLQLFAKKMGYRRADAKEFHEGVKYLQKVGALEVKQGGFVGDSMHHPKIVLIRDWNAINLHFQLPVEAVVKKFGPRKMILYESTCALPNVRCTSRKFLKSQGMVCIFAGTCNQKRSILNS